MVVTAIISALTAATRRRVGAAMRSTKKAMPTFSPRASAPAAPKKLSATIKPRATSSAHSSGWSKTKRDSTEVQTTSRSANRNSAAMPSTSHSIGRINSRSIAGSVAAGIVTEDAFTSGSGGFDLIDQWLGIRACLCERLWLREHAGAAGRHVAFAVGDALLFQHLGALGLGFQAALAGVDGGLLGGIEETVVQIGGHPLEAGLTDETGQ